MTRDELIEAGAQALANCPGHRWGHVAVVLDVIEPLIRADERERNAGLSDSAHLYPALERASREVHRLNSELDAAREYRAALRAKVEALRTGTGWYEFIKQPEATTHAAYVHENGETFVTELGWFARGEFALLADGREQFLVPLDDVLALFGGGE